MMRLLAILVAGLALPALLIAQAEAPDVDKLAKEGLRIIDAMSDELEAIAGNKDAKDVAARQQKLKKHSADLDDYKARVNKLPQPTQEAMAKKYQQELKTALERRNAAEGKLGNANVPGDPNQKEADAKSDPLQEIVKRLKDNGEKAADLLSMNDPGKDTLKTQDDIIKDLKELLKQNQPDNNSSGQGQGNDGGDSGDAGGNSGPSGGNSESTPRGSGGGTPQGGSGKGPMNQGQSGGKDDQKTQGSAGKEQGSNQKAKEKDGGNGSAKKDNEDKKDGGAGPSPKEKDDKGKDGNGGGSAKNDDKKKDKKDDQSGGLGVNDQKKDNDKTADLFKDGHWGHLQGTKRQEIETYANRRLMPRYEDHLRQYYRAIAEQSRRE